MKRLMSSMVRQSRAFNIGSVKTESKKRCDVVAFGAGEYKNVHNYVETTLLENSGVVTMKVSRNNIYILGFSPFITSKGIVEVV